MLRLVPPAHEAALGWLVERADVTEGEGARLLAMTDGAPGRAWRLGASGALDLDSDARNLMEALPRPDPVAMIALADGFRGSEGAARFAVFMQRWAERVRDLATSRCGTADPSDRRKFDALAEVWDTIALAPRLCETLNLDRGDAFFTALSRLRAVA